jgi:ABC-2 type transport system permease protein
MLIIAQREFMSYARTAGFWLTVLLPLLAGGLGFFAPQIIEGASQDRALAVVDLTGENLGPRVQTRLLEQADSRTARAMESVATASAGPEAGKAVELAYDTGGLDAARAAFQREAPGAAQRFKLPRQTLRLVPPPPGLPSGREAVNAALRPYVAGDRTLPDGSELHAAAVLHRTPRAGRGPLERQPQLAATSRTRCAPRYATNPPRPPGRCGPGARTAGADGQISPKIRLLSPRAATGGEVSLRDRLPPWSAWCWASCCGRSC